MADQTSTQLAVSARQPDGSRKARRTRRDGRVPGILYGGGEQPLSFEVDARELRLALAKAGAVLDLSVDGDAPTPVVLKEAQRHPVRGETVHVDLLRVRLDKPIQAVVALELTDLDDAPGVREGGVLEQITRELNIEALPTGIPESIVHDVAEMKIGETLMLAAVTPPAGVTLLDAAGGDGAGDAHAAAPAERRRQPRSKRRPRSSARPRRPMAPRAAPRGE